MWQPAAARASKRNETSLTASSNNEYTDRKRQKERKREIQSVSDESEEEVHNPLKMATAEWMTVKLIRRHREW